MCLHLLKILNVALLFLWLSTQLIFIDFEKREVLVIQKSKCCSNCTLKCPANSDWLPTRLKNFVALASPNNRWNFPAFPLLFYLVIYLFFVCVVFSVSQCITWHYPSKFELQRISWKQFGLKHNCQADKTFLLSFTLKCSSFFFLTSNIHKAAKLLTCVRGATRLLHSSMPHYAKLHSVYLKNTEHFSTIKKHVI